MTDPTSEELAFVRRWAAAQSPAVKCHNGADGFWFYPMTSIIDRYAKCRATFPNPDAAWSALAIAIRPYRASLVPVIAGECAVIVESTTVMMDGIVIESLNANRCEMVRRIRALK